MTNSTKSLYRLPKQGQIAGVCAGLGDYFNIDVAVIRLIFVLSAFITGGTMILIYIIMAVVLPVSEDVDEQKNSSAKSYENGETIGQKVQNLGQDLRENGAVGRARNYFGIFLLVLGVWLLLEQFLPQWVDLRWSLIWPVLLIIVGFLVIVRRRN